MIKLKLILTIAKTHMVSKLKQTIIAALGVTFGIGSYITLVSFMTGLNDMLDDLMLNQTPHVHIFSEIEPSKYQPLDLASDFEKNWNIISSIKPKLSQKKIHNAVPIINYLNKDENVRGAIPQVKTQIFYIAGSIELGGNLTGIDVMQEIDLFNFENYVVEGAAEALKNTESGIILGAGIAEKLSLKVNDRLQVSTSSGKLFPLKIVGIYQSGIADLDNIQSFATINTVQRILGEPENYITDINLKLYNIDKAFPMAKTMEQQFHVKAVDINTANAQFETGTSIRNLITYAVSITLLIVAGFGIYNILNMIIYEKMKDIAILKATGFSGKDVQLIFMAQAIIIGIIGGIAGLILGFALSSLIDKVPFTTQALPTITTYPINYRIDHYYIGILFAVLSTFFAGYLPSLKAKKIDPVDIIRGQ
ncbi:MAG: FtsX-like permease family protein [Aequorivita sp.]